MPQPRILVAGIGNIFLGDDGFGVEVIRRLAGREQPPGVQMVDYGIRGLDLAFALLDGYDLAILVDALPRGGPPGKLYLLEPDLESLGQADIQTHNMDPVKVLQMVKAFGELPPSDRVRIVGCEPGTFGPEGTGQMGLSEPVQAAVDEAAQMVEQLIYSFREEFETWHSQQEGTAAAGSQPQKG
ncbi:MAG: hydrogenase maturation protease [Chloroflexi bacterium]|nr:MAG: hydrogenase maturation protease [Chloroflexota bacterium]